MNSREFSGKGIIVFCETTMMNNKNKQKSAGPTDIPTEPWGFVSVTSSGPTDIPTEPW